MKTAMITPTELARTHKIFIDTCSIMEPFGRQLIGTDLAGALYGAGTKAIVPYSVARELNQLTERKEARVVTSAAKAISLINGMREAGLLEIRGDSNDPFGDASILALFTRYRTQHPLAIVTQDRDLAMDLLDSLLSTRSVQSNKRAEILRIGRNCELRRWHREPTVAAPASGKPGCPPPGKSRSRMPQGDRAVPAPDLVTAGPIVGSGKKVTEGEAVVGKSGARYELVEQLGQGGEGTVYQTACGQACKVYAPKQRTADRQDKLQAMIQGGIRDQRIGWPVDVVYCTQGAFCGYIMPLAQGRPIQTTLFSKPLLMRNFPAWTRRELVVFAIDLFEAIELLHNRRILLGDINGLNIMVTAGGKPFIVDTDSCQIGGFPSPVGTPTFTAPELQGKALGKMLRTEDQENFAVATLLFMLMLPGKPPYSHMGAGDPTSNVRESHFPYPFGEIHGQGLPPGPWRCAWSHLPFAMKEGFHNCFANSARLSVQEWLTRLRGYQHALNKGYLGPELFPESLKPVSDHAQDRFGADGSNQQHSTCSRCGESFILNGRQAEHPMCRTCWTKKKQCVTFTCKCGKQETTSLAALEDVRTKRGPTAKPRCRSCQTARRVKSKQPSMAHHGRPTKQPNSTYGQRRTAAPQSLLTISAEWLRKLL